MSKRIIIDLPDNYDDVLTFTAIGSSWRGVNVTMNAVDIQQHQHIRIGEDASLHYINDEEDQQ